MRAKDLKHIWKTWTPNADNSGANMDIPLEESVSGNELTATVKEIINTSSAEFTKPMTGEDFIASLRNRHG
jgi:hypothetical protein